MPSSTSIHSCVFRSTHLILLLVIGLSLSRNDIYAQREATLKIVQDFQASTAAFVIVDSIDDTHALYSYRDGGTASSSDLKAVIGEVNPSTGVISFGTPVTVESNNINHGHGVVVLSTTQAVVAYELDGGAGTDDGKAVVLTLDVDSNSITNVGSTTSFGTDIDASFSHSTFGLVKLSSSTFAVAYSDNGDSDHGEVRIGTVSGTTVSLGSDQTFASFDAQNIWVTALSASKIVVTFEDDASSDHGKAIVGDISGTTVTFGSAVTFNSASTSYTAAQALSSSQFVVIYVLDDSNDYLYSKVGTVSGTGITFGSQVTVEDGQDTRDLTIDYLTETEFVLAFNGGHDDDSRVRVGEISGTDGAATISYNTADTFLSTEADGSWVTALSADLFMIGYIDDQSAAPDNPEYIVGTLPSTAPTSATVAATVFLEGAYNGTNLNTTLNSSIPDDQPYSGSTYNNHSGSENASPPANAVDWVLVELREAGSAATALDATKVGSAAGFLMNDGTIKATDGASDLTVSLSGNSSDEFYVVIYHRNHLPIMSANAISESSSKYTIDFTSNSANTYQTTTALVSLSGSKFGMPAGDTDGDGDIDADDLSTWRTNNGITFSYGSNGEADFNLDGVINAVDRNDYHQKNTSKTRQVPSS